MRQRGGPKSLRSARRSCAMANCFTQLPSARKMISMPITAPLTTFCDRFSCLIEGKLADSTSKGPPVAGVCFWVSGGVVVCVVWAPLVFFFLFSSTYLFLYL